MFRARQTSWVSSHFSLLTVPNFFLTASTCTDKSLTCCFNRKYALFSITINSITNLIYDFTIYKANKSTFQHPTKLPKSKSPVGAHCHSSKYKILRSDLKYFHTTIPLPIFAQTKTLIISIIKGNACYLHPCSNSIPPLTSFPLSYIFIPLLFCTTAFSFTSAFCRVFGKCSFNSFPPVSSPSPAAHHTHPICSGPATCFLSFQIFHGN